MYLCQPFLKVSTSGCSIRLLWRSHEGAAAAGENSVRKTQVDLTGSTPAGQDSAAAKAIATANSPLVILNWLRCPLQPWTPCTPAPLQSLTRFLPGCAGACPAWQAKATDTLGAYWHLSHRTDRCKAFMLTHTGSEACVYLSINVCVHAGCADKRPAASSRAKSTSSIMIDKGQQWGHDKYQEVQAVPFTAQKITRLEHVPIDDPDPEYPPGFNPAVRVHSTLDFPGLASESIKRHVSVPNLGSSTSAAGQLSFSLATAKSTEAPLPPTFSKIPVQARNPPNELPEPVTRMPPGLKVTCQAALTAPLPSHTHTASPEPDSHEQTSSNAHGAGHCVEPQRPGSSDQQPKQQGWDLHSDQSHQAPQQSGWDVDSDSEPGAAWSPFSDNQHSQGTHSQQANEATSIPESGWRPDQYQGTAAKPTSSFTPSRFHKLQQQRTHSTHQYSPKPLAMSPISVSKRETEPHQKTPIRAGGWNPEIFQGQKSPVRVGGWNPHRYQGTGAADYNHAVASTVEEQQQHPSSGHDNSLHKVLSYAFPKAYRPHSTSEARRLSSAHVPAEQSDPNLDDSLRHIYLQCHASSSAISRHHLELGVDPDGVPHAAAALSNQKAGQMQSQSWEDRSSQSKPQASSPFPGGFGLHPSHRAMNSEGIHAQSPSHHSLYSASEKDLNLSSSSLHATNGSAYDDPSGYDKQDQQYLLSRQYSRGSDQLEGEVPMWGDSEGDDAEGVDPEGEVPLWDDSEGNDAEGADPEREVPVWGDSEGAVPEGGDGQGADPGGIGPQGADPEGCDSGYTTQVSMSREFQ